MIIVLVSAFIFMYCLQSISPLAANLQCGKVHLTVSAQDSLLEMNWITECSPYESVPDYIILSSKNIRHRDEDHGVLTMVKFSDHRNGYFKTKIKFGHPWLPGGWDYMDQISKASPGPHCFPYWISSVNMNYSIDSRCLAIQPTWMSDNRLLLGNRRISSLLIPGTHNSGSFSGVPIFLENYILNQDRDIWTQLVFGIRYLDFRIGYYGKEGFYVNHDLVRVTRAQPLFQQLKKFLQAAPNEVVILDFHRFPYPSNFTLDIHNKFIDLLYEEFGTYAVPSTDMRGGKGPTLNEIWAKNRNLIICYGNKEAVRDSYWLWNPLPQYWANTKSNLQLKQYIDRIISEHGMSSTINPLWALMAELTPQPIDVIFGTNNLKKLAQNVNSEVTKWFKNEFSNGTNIVATDFFLGNDIVDVAINTNTRGKS